MKISSSNLLTFLVLIYYILTMMFPHNNPHVETLRILPQTTMALICIYCLWISIKKQCVIIQERSFRYFYILIMMGFLYSAIANRAETFKNILDFLKNFMSISFMFTLFVLLHQNERITKRNIFIIFCMQIIYVFYTLWMDKTMGYAYNETENIFDSNAGFLFECCIPMALIFPVKRLRLYLYVLLFAGCMYAGQRSAILAAVVSFPFCLNYLKQNIKINDIVILSVLSIVAIVPILNVAIENLMARHDVDMASGSYGSGRSIFWGIVWEHFWKNDLIYILFGNGCGSVPQLLKRTYGMAIGAHNGWLDYLYTYGIVGIFVYAKSLLSILTGNKRINNDIAEYKNMFLIIFIVFMMKCTTSHGDWDISVMPIAMTMAIILYDYKKYASKTQNGVVEDVEDRGSQIE